MLSHCSGSSPTSDAEADECPGDARPQRCIKERAAGREELGGPGLGLWEKAKTPASRCLLTLAMPWNVLWVRAAHTGQPHWQHRTGASARARPSCSRARPSLPPQPGSCRFSAPDFLVEVKHVYGSTIGKLEKYPGKIECPVSCPTVLSVHPSRCFFSQQQGLPR